MNAEQKELDANQAYYHYHVTVLQYRFKFELSLRDYVIIVHAYRCAHTGMLT